MESNAGYRIGVYQNGRIRVDSPIALSVPAPAVWAVLADLHSWRAWNDALVVLPGAGDPTAFAVGSALKLKCRQSLGWGLRKTTLFDVRISEFEPGKKIVWEGRHLGVRGRHGYEIEVVDQTNSRLQQWEEIFGPGARVAGWIGVLDGIGGVHVNWNRALASKMGVRK